MPSLGRRAKRLAVGAAVVAALLCAGQGPFGDTVALAQATTLRPHYFRDASADQASYLDIAGALGLIQGEGGVGGICRPDDPVTRSEFAAVILRLMSLDPAFKPPEGAGLALSDAAAIPAWAQDAVSTCLSLGIATVVPDGHGEYLFRPHEAVAGADALAMFLRALGNAEGITGGWPAGFVFRAWETGLLPSDAGPGDWRVVESLVPITRAQLACLLTNALSCPRGYRSGGPWYSGTFAQAPIAGSVAAYATVGEVDLGTRSLAAIDGRTYSLARTVVSTWTGKTKDLLGRKVYVLRNDRGWVVYLRRLEGEPTLTGKVVALHLRSNGGEVESVELDGSRTVACRPGAIVELNGRRWPFAPGLILPTARATIFQEGGRAVYVSIIQDDFPAAVIRGLEYDPPGPGGQVTGSMTLGAALEPGTLPVDVDAQTEIYLEGQRVGFTDLRERDVCYVATSGTARKTALRVYAHRQQVSGLVTQVFDVYMVDSVYRRAEVRQTHGTTITVTFGDLCESQAGADLTGEELTFCFGQEGEVVYFGPQVPLPGRAHSVKLLAVHDFGASRLLSIDWRGEPVTYLLPDSAGKGFSPMGGFLAFLWVDAGGSVTRLAPVAPALNVVTVESVDPDSGQVDVKTETGTWTVNLLGVPIYAVDRGGGLGPYVPLERLAPAQTLWLDDRWTPHYALAGPPGGG